MGVSLFCGWGRKKTSADCQMFRRKATENCRKTTENMEKRRNARVWGDHHRIFYIGLISRKHHIKARRGLCGTSNGFKKLVLGFWTKCTETTPSFNEFWGLLISLPERSVASPRACHSKRVFLTNNHLLGSLPWFSMILSTLWVPKAVKRAL